jgi:hypothetical protein
MGTFMYGLISLVTKCCTNFVIFWSVNKVIAVACGCRLERIFLLPLTKHFSA